MLPDRSSSFLDQFSTLYALKVDQVLLLSPLATYFDQILLRNPGENLMCFANY